MGAFITTTQERAHRVRKRLSILGLLTIAFAVAHGSVSAQDNAGDDYGIWYVQGEAQSRGGFLFPDVIVSGNIHEPLDKAAFTPDRDGFLIFLGEDDAFSIDRSYFVGLDARFDDPLITVSTFYDSPYLEEYARLLGTEVESLADRLGLESASHSVQTVPVGHPVARNARGTSFLTFAPVPGDIGAYLIVIASYQATAHGDYHVTLVAED